MAMDPTPARSSAPAPRSSAASAVRAATTSDDQRSTIAGFPRNAASERITPAASGSEKSGAGNGSYIQAACSGKAGEGAVYVLGPVVRGLRAYVSRQPTSMIRMQVYSGTL